MTMAVKVNKIVNVDEINKKVTADLFSDTKAEMSTVTTDEIIGFPKGYELDFGSSVTSAALDIGMMQSDGTWNWGN